MSYKRGYKPFEKWFGVFWRMKLRFGLGVLGNKIGVLKSALTKKLLLEIRKGISQGCLNSQDVEISRKILKIIFLRISEYFYGLRVSSKTFSFGGISDKSVQIEFIGTFVLNFGAILHFLRCQHWVRFSPWMTKLLILLSSWKMNGIPQRLWL